MRARAIPIQYYCHNIKCREKVCSLVSLGICNIVVCLFITLFVLMYIREKSVYQHTTDKLLYVTNFTDWKPMISGCVFGYDGVKEMNTLDIASYLPCDLVKHNRTMIHTHPKCMNNFNQTCNISIYNSITFKFTRGIFLESNRRITSDKSVQCPLPEYTECYEQAYQKFNWLSDVVCERDDINVCFRTKSEPNHTSQVFYLFCGALASLVEIGILLLFIMRVRYYYDKDYLQQERNLRKLQEEQKDQLLNIVMESKK